jgi:ADP-glucose pyrophosphorylase
LESNATLLKKFGGSIMSSQAYENTVIIQPVRIGSGCDIRNSIIGPNVTIGDKATLIPLSSKTLLLARTPTCSILCWIIP